MRLLRWLAAVGVVFGVGLLQAAQRNALVLNGYAVGARVTRAHAEENDLRRLRTEVAGLASPAELARFADRHDLTLVAWTPAAPDPLVRLAGGPSEPGD
jgi:hypothetical protein